MKMLSRLVLMLAAVMMLSGLTAVSTAAKPEHHSQMWQACHDTPVAAHRGVVTPNVDENTMKSIRLAVKQGAEIIEGDFHPSRNGTPWYVHNLTVDSITNGHGPLGSKTDKELRRLRTPHGSKLLTGDQLISFMKHHPTVEGQWELKDFNWTWKRLKAFGDAVVEAGIEDQVAWSSGSLRLLLQMAVITPGMRLEWIGFNEDLPPLAKFGTKIDQANVLYRAAFHHYGGYASYIRAAHARGIAVSARSTASGEGDTPTVWAREIKAGVDQLVTNRLARYNSWCNSV